MSKTKRRIEKLEQFEKSICTIIDNYFETNEKHDLDFSTDCSSDKFYHFVKSVDEKFKKLSKIEEENKAAEESIVDKMMFGTAEKSTAVEPEEVMDDEF
jgi:hypothetical protein